MQLRLLLLLLALLLARLGVVMRKLRLCLPFFYAVFWRRRCHEDKVVFYSRAGGSTTHRMPERKVRIRGRHEKEGCGYRDELADQVE